MLFFLGTFLYAGFILLILTYFDLGRSAWFDAWVNYDQVTGAIWLERQTCYIVLPNVLLLNDSFSAVGLCFAHLLYPAISSRWMIATKCCEVTPT